MARTARARWPQRSTRHGRTDEERLPPYLSGGHRSSRSAGVPSLALRFVGALALLAMAAVHLQQFLGAHYSDIPTIGTLFALNFAGGTLIAIVLLAPIERISGSRGKAVTTVLALAGIAIAAMSIAFLLITESTSLFGFRESGYRPVIVVALVSEGTAALSLAAFLAARIRAIPTQRGR